MDDDPIGRDGDQETGRLDKAQLVDGLPVAIGEVDRPRRNRATHRTKTSDKRDL
jgi:hypothetical protein